MANRTSKSASEPHAASSPSGMSEGTDPTGGKFGFVVDRIMKKTPEKTVQVLIRIGVLTEDGHLTEHYKLRKKAKAKKSEPSKAVKPTEE